MKKVFLLSIIAILLYSCSSVMITGRRQLLLVSNSEVLAMSATAFKQFIDSVPASQNYQQSQMIERVGKNISSAVEDYMRKNGLEKEIANFNWEFRLVKDTTVNAFCMPGGKVVFFEGILPITQTEAGAAVVMGHEIAHAVAKHSNERISQQMAAQYGAAITNILLSNRSEVTRATIGALYGIGAQVGVILPYSRKHEYEADRLGLIFMAMAGYDPNEAISFWQRMMDNKSGSVFEFMSTHPSDEKRIANMKQVLPEAMGYYNARLN